MRLTGSTSELPAMVGPWDHGFTVQRYFGDNGVNDYMRAASNGRFSYVPAVDDGVVEADYPGTISDLGNAPRTGVAALRAVDQAVDFASFDRNGNGFVDGRELAIEVVVLGGDRVGPGETRPIAGYDPSLTELDGVGFGGDFMVATVNGYSTFMTDVHELFHQAFDTYDAYYWGVGRLDVMGPTYGVPDSERWMPSAVTRLQLGWINPTVVEADGTYGIGDGVIVHDPAVSDARSFLIEDRGGPWDSGASARGPVVWRISNDLPRNAANDYVRAVELITPVVVGDNWRVAGCERGGCRGGDESDAFASPATIGLRYTSSAPTYTSGEYSGIALSISRETVTVQFGVREPAPVMLPKGTTHRVLASASTEGATSTTIGVASALAPTVFDAADLQGLVQKMCALGLPGCAVYQLQQILLYP